jgi:hypothetical protein
MTISINSIINETFILRLKGLQTGQVAKSNPLTSDKSEVSLSSTLRFGAKTLGDAVQRINGVIAAFNVAEDKLNKLSDIIVDTADIVDKATKPDLSSPELRRLDLLYQNKGREFRDLLESSEFGEVNLLTRTGVSDLLRSAGLDENSSSQITVLLKSFYVEGSDESLVSEEVTGKTKLSSKGTVPRFNELFDGITNIRSTGAAVSVAAKLKTLSVQIEQNKSSFKNSLELLRENLQLTRDTGFIFLEQADQIKDTESATEVAKKLARQIRLNVPEALSQAENLESIVVAALAGTGVI